MELRDTEALLKRMKLRQLEPALQREILEFAEQMGYETTITASSNLHFLLKLYKAEMAKEKKSRKALKKAEELILRLSSLHYDIIRREGERRKEELKRKIPFTGIRGGAPISEKTRRALESIGITDEAVMEQAVELFGDAKIDERVGLVNSTNLGDKVIKKVFGTHPETILIPNDGDFVSELDAMEIKKAIIDDWSEARGLPPPPWADYLQTPGILLDSYHDISRLLGLKVSEEKDAMPEESEEKRKVNYTGKPMVPADFIKVVIELGFEVTRESKHGILLRNASGVVMCVQKAHRKQEELNPSTIKKKLREAKIDLDEFERTRRDLHL